MMRKFAILSLALLLFSSCKQTGETAEAGKTSFSYAKIDPHSYARQDQVKVKHAALDIEVDFVAEQIRGTIQLYFDNFTQADTLYLDAKELEIKAVSISEDGKSLKKTPYFEGEKDDILGTPLAILITPKTQYVEIEYATDPNAEALQWLEPQLTAGKKHPFLLTQSQAINARTWLPIQDSPGIRYTYEARVKIPSELLAVMSASNPVEKNAEGIYTFEMKQPIPAYLMALAVGDLTFKSVGARTGIYADPVIIDKAAYEFGEMEQMLELAEGIYGPYRWERYDVIVLPPSFPFGGMENPRITFATPTILAGDRSLISLIAHEMAHSWSGNLVTNATWDDFWLNEGFTVYFEYRIMEALKGRDYSEMLAQLSYQDLLAEVEDLDAVDTHLKLKLLNRHPDDGMTSIAYDKGYYLLRLIEETVGREKFDVFLKSYFTENAFKTMDTETFLERLDKELLSEEKGWKEAIGIDEWVYGPGVPANVPVADPKRFEQVDAARDAWVAGAKAKDIAPESWSTHQWLHFIRTLPDSVSGAQLAELDQAFLLTQSTNAEIQCAWYKRAVETGYSEAYGAMEEFLIAVGRRKFLMPLYRAMKEKGQAELACGIYAKARPNYHPISYNSVDELLGCQ
jgi:aminopeptidase N